MYSFSTILNADTLEDAVLLQGIQLTPEVKEVSESLSDRFNCFRLLFVFRKKVDSVMVGESYTCAGISFVGFFD